MTRCSPLRRTRRPAGLVVGLVATVLLAACASEAAVSSSPDDAPAPTPALDSGYVGTIDGTDAFIALVVSGSNAAVYACDGDGGTAEYFWGPTEDDTAVQLDSPTGASVHAELVDGAFAGTLTFADGSEHTFTSRPAVGDAGMYLVVGEQAVAADVSAGWILDNDGDERGALRRHGSFQATPPFDPGGLVLEDEGFAMTKLTIGTNAIVSPNNIISPNIISPNNIISPDSLLLIPSPAGPIPVPVPNTTTVTTSR